MVKIADRNRGCSVALTFALGLLLSLSARAAAAEPQAAGPLLHRNELEIGEVARHATLDVKDPLAVFDFVLGALPERVDVLPTENYYYFHFVLNGAPYTGNIRLAANDRDRGIVHFSYGERPTDLWPQPGARHLALDASHGVTVERIGPLAYRVSRNGKSVTFALNDLAKVQPPAGLLGADERYLGPVFDESAIRFFLVFNVRLKLFHFLLDDRDGVADALVAAKATDRITIGRRTGFAFYRDDRGRRVLIGVDRRNSELNTYFDGPFDQLPDNFIDGEALRDAILAVNPELKGQIDRLGNFAGGEDRYLIHPYLRYRREADLTVFHRCATSRRVPAAERPRCFVIADEDSDKANPQPLALKRR